MVQSAERRWFGLHKWKWNTKSSTVCHWDIILKRGHHFVTNFREYIRNVSVELGANYINMVHVGGELVSESVVQGESLAHSILNADLFDKRKGRTSFIISSMESSVSGALRSSSISFSPHTMTSQRFIKGMRNTPLLCYRDYKLRSPS